jgi:hypothetical protein
MSEGNNRQKRELPRREPLKFLGPLSFLIVVVDLFVLSLYFAGMSVLMLVSLPAAEPTFFVAFLCHFAAALLTFFSTIGTILCCAGIIVRKSIFKWLLVTLSVLGMAAASFFLYVGPDDLRMVYLLRLLAGLSGLLLISSLIAFRYMESRPAKG